MAGSAYAKRHLPWYRRFENITNCLPTRCRINLTTLGITLFILVTILYFSREDTYTKPIEDRLRHIFDLSSHETDIDNMLEAVPRKARKIPFTDHKGKIVMYKKPLQRNITHMDFVLPVDDDEMIERKLDRTFTAPRRRLPKALTVGIAKCGTAALHFFLSLNPALVPSKCESNYLAVYQRYKQGYNAYRSLMQPSYAHQITIDRGTFYAVLPELWPRILATNNKMKFLMVVCDPVTRDISHFTHKINTQKPENDSTTMPTFEQYRFENGVVKSALLRYKYDELILPWLPYLASKRLHIVDGNRLKTHPVEELQQIEDFLGLERAITYKNVVFNKEKRFYCKFIDGEEVCMTSQKGRVHPFVSDRLKNKLKVYYRPHMRKFFKLIGRDFSWSVMNMTSA